MENFLNLAKEIDFQEVQESQRVPKKLDLRNNVYNSNIHNNENVDTNVYQLRDDQENSLYQYNGILFCSKVDEVLTHAATRINIERSHLQRATYCIILFM